MRDLSVGKESRIIFQFAVPMLVGNVFQQLYTIINRIIVGNFIGKQALAAVGASFPLLFTLISLVIGVGIGATIIIAQYFGAKDIKNVVRTIDTLLIFMFFASILVTLLSILISKPIFKLIQLPDDILPYAVDYFYIYMLGSVFFFGFISQAVALSLAIIYLNRTHDFIKLNWRKPQFDRAIMNKSLKIGFPVGFQQAFVALSMLAMYWLVNRFGTDATAAYSVVFRIDTFASMPGMNFAMALSAFVGQNLGAQKPERVRRGLLSTFYMTSAFSVVISLIGIFFAGQVMRVFTNDPEVIAIGKDYLQIVTGFYIVFSTMFVVGGVMRGAGDTFVPMLITFFALWVVRIPVGYFLSQKFGYHGIWWSVPIAWAVGLGLSFLLEDGSGRS